MGGKKDIIRNASFSQEIRGNWTLKKLRRRTKRTNFQQEKPRCPVTKTLWFYLEAKPQVFSNKTFCERDLALFKNAGHKILDYFRLIWNIWGWTRGPLMVSSNSNHSMVWWNKNLQEKAGNHGKALLCTPKSYKRVFHSFPTWTFLFDH